MMKVGLLSIALVGLGRCASTTEGSKGIGQTVSTDSGPVCGHAAPRAPEVSEYLGIPFAKPPIGDLRFAPSQRYFGNAVINGTSFGYSCPISSAYTSLLTPSPDAGINFTKAGTKIMNAIAQVGGRFSEDCLTLNIWTKPAADKKLKPVMVWIYGGGYVAGNSDASTYDGAHLVDQEDIVLVTINYRTNIFGFPGFEGGTNLGLQDQRLGVEWVRDNIAAFGGDPSRMTLAGESAGGGSVDFYSYAWTKDPIVEGFIAQSGTVGLLPRNNQSTSTEAWLNASSILGCGDAKSDQAKVLNCMRSKTTGEISEAISKLPNFTPSVDEKVVFSDYEARSLSGNFIKKPLLIGYNDYEAGMFKIISLLANTSLPDTYWSTMEQSAFFCPAAARANVSVHNNVPTWRYRYFGEFPNMQLSSTVHTGAYHGSDVNPLFDTIPEGAGIPPSTKEEVEIGKYMRGAWAAFVKDPEHGLSTYGWPKFEPNTESLVRLGYENRTGPNAAFSAGYDAPCGEMFPS